MRNKHIYFAIVFMMILQCIACKPFDELNTDPTKSSSMDPNMQLSYVQLSTYGMVEPITAIQSYASSFVQHFQGEYNTTYHGGIYRRVDQMSATIWSEYYNKPIKNLVDIIHHTQEDPALSNLNAVSRIYKVYLFSLLTDLFGDIPYSEAGKGYIDQNFTPRYDQQKDIYTDFFTELSAASVQLGNNPSAKAINGDVIYNGNLALWKRLANSLHLRYAMRLTKVNPQLAMQEVTKALDPARGGLITSTDQQALISYLPDIFDWDANEIRRNAQAQVYIGRESAPLPFICSSLWNMLRDSQDPRLFRIGRIYWGEKGNYTGLESFNRKDLTEEALNRSGISIFQPVNPGYYWWEKWPSGYWSNKVNAWVDKWTRPQLNQAFLKGNIPGVIMTYSEVQLLFAEAKLRWPTLATGSTVEEHYNKGVNAAMELLSGTYKTSIITADEKQNYWQTHPFPATYQQQLKCINEQLWILHLTNPTEAYANWRRSGYPILKNANEYGAITIDAQTIPRRLPYPLFEKSYNPLNYQQAIDRLGGTDNWIKGVWWDKN